MSEKQFEPCTLEQATHVEVGGKVHLLESDKIALEYYHSECIGLGWVKEDAFIPKELFPILGIKPLRERKRKPIEFEFTFSGGMAFPLKAYGKTFLCVEIVEEKK